MALTRETLAVASVSKKKGKYVVCTHPITVGFKADGKTLAWSQKTRSKEYAPFQLPCNKCVACRLNYASDWAKRSVDEAQMHPNNSFITLTYSDENLKDPKLNYRDFQLFMKRLRKKNGGERVSYIVAGEYGERTKRPHWHAIIFNWAPRDATYFRSNHRGDKVFKSQILDDLWGLGAAEIGSVTKESAGYVARYSAKKLVHGDEVDNYEPIFKVSSKRGIGKSWLEKYYADIFDYGRCSVNGKTTNIPRYYLKWFAANKPDEYLRYITEVRTQKQERARVRKEKELKAYNDEMQARGLNKPKLQSPLERERKVQLERFKRLKQKF